MPVLSNISLLATCRPAATQGDCGLIPDAALAWDGGRITWVGAERDLPQALARGERLDARGMMVIPGLIDCHTHLAFGGWRDDEFERRILGASYLDIARAGGGIASTVMKTRALGREALVDRCRGFLAEMVSLGVTTVEAKSGYGLTVSDELMLLETYRDVAREERLRIVPTLLGAHVVPPEFRDDRAGYVDLLIRELIPEVARRGLARFCDVFVEDSAFTVAEARAILRAGLEHGLRPKLHADQLSASGGAELAAEVGAASADHLEHACERGIRAMREAGVTAVSLPIASLYLRQPPLPARAMLAAGLPVAVATDFNPGSAPSYHLPLALTLACTLQRMTPAEALMGATSVAARAIGVEQETGSLEVGKAADFAVIDAPSVNHWLYHFRPNACRMTVIGGEVRWCAEERPTA
ncbi:MAG: imidazolonepropionase [Gemmatimonadota bacterium]